MRKSVRHRQMGILETKEAGVEEVHEVTKVEGVGDVVAGEAVAAVVGEVVVTT